MIYTAEEFVRLRESDDPNLYRRSALEEALEIVWMEIIEKFPEMHFWVAQNKTVPLSILSILAKDTDPRVRFMVASKRKLSFDLQEFLANDTEESVRLALARNPKTHRSILQKLIKDNWKEVSEIAKVRYESQLNK